MYPLALVKATAIAWLFTGLRSDELARLRVGCIEDVPEIVELRAIQG